MSAGGSDLDKYDHPLSLGMCTQITVLTAITELFSNFAHAVLSLRTKFESYATKHVSCLLKRAT